MILASTSQEGSSKSQDQQPNAKELPAVEVMVETTTLNSDYQTEAYQLEDLFSENEKSS